MIHLSVAPLEQLQRQGESNEYFTCSVLPSTQDILGGGTPCPEQDRDPPVLLENPWYEGGS